MKKEKILVANRGEIALRIIRAAKELGIKTVAIYSEADRESTHHRFADQSICIGPSDPIKSYLHIPTIISAAQISGATAIHPGYGFLSENAKFARISEQCGYCFIGPNSYLIQNLGDKITSKEIMSKAGLPLVPGSDGEVNSPEEAKEIAKEIGYPILIKASAGGGGRGMKIVREPGEIEQSFHQAKAESQAAFNNSQVFIEKFIENPHHVEFQVMGDLHGNIKCFGDRECSIQRRHQKILEEASSPHLSNRKRTKMEKTVIKALEQINYQNAGTVEFIMDDNQDFYFLEVNTRIQVEHPVTEMIYGIDLIKIQILSSFGEKIDQINPTPHGHSIECRINAEHPKTFIPSPGKITGFHMPSGPGVRMDTIAYSGCQVSPFYDSMIGKLIVHGMDRKQAIAKMLRCLDELIIEGIETNLPLHKEILRNKMFCKPNYNTNFLSTLMR